MSITFGIGLPAAHGGATGENLVEWARRADAGPFSSLLVVDRIVYQNMEPLLALAAAAAVTNRIRLATGILLSPLHSAGIIAKQAATIHSLSGGRMTLGLGVGSRADDFEATNTPMKGRGRLMEQQMDLMFRVWSGQKATEDTGPIGPVLRPGDRPEVLIGARSDAALARVGRWSDGYVATPRSPEALAGYLDLVHQSWASNNRQGKPRLVAIVFFALGPDAQEQGQRYVSSYYSYRADIAEQAAQGVLSSPQAVTDALRAYDGLGIDELVALPCNPAIDQVDRLADILG